jgi:hypothetical protein
LGSRKYPLHLLPHSSGKKRKNPFPPVTGSKARLTDLALETGALGSMNNVSSLIITRLEQINLTENNIWKVCSYITFLQMGFLPQYPRVEDI